MMVQSSQKMQSSCFITYMLTYINRLIIIDSNWFISEVLQPTFQEENMNFAQFVGQWIKKMDQITS